MFSSLSSFSVSPSALSSLKLHRHPWVLDFGGWINVDRRAGFGSVGWDRLMVGLDQLIGGFEMVDRLIGGWIVWVDHR